MKMNKFDKEKRLIMCNYISKRVRELRKSRGWSQEKLGQMMGSSVPSISRIERGNRLPSMITIMKLAEAFNVPISEISGEL